MRTEKRRKLDNEKWGEEFVFILPPHANPKPLHLICQITTAVCSCLSNGCYHEMKHTTFSIATPLVAQQGKNILTLKLSYSATSINLTTAAAKGTAALLRVTWELAKKGEPYVEAELVQVCTLGIVELLFSQCLDQPKYASQVFH